MDRDPDPRDEVQPRLALPAFRPVTIPPSLHSAYSGEPFRKCSVCAAELAKTGIYEVQKTWHRSECVFELALCPGCSDRLSREFSQESIAAMKGYLLCNFQPRPHNSACNFCDTPRELFQSYTSLGVCRGARADAVTDDGARSPPGFPCGPTSPSGNASDESESRDQLLLPILFMCESCGNELDRCLSDKTRKAQGDFIRDHFPGVPADMDFRPTFPGCL